MSHYDNLGTAFTPKLPTFKSVEKKCNEDSYDGWCTKCGKWTHHSCEPDAVKYECPKCKTRNVYGAQELAIQGMFK